MKYFAQNHWFRVKKLDSTQNFSICFSLKIFSFQNYRTSIFRYDFGSYDRQTPSFRQIFFYKRSTIKSATLCCIHIPGACTENDAFEPRQIRKLNYTFHNDVLQLEILMNFHLLNLLILSQLLIFGQVFS